MWRQHQEKRGGWEVLECLGALVEARQPCKLGLAHGPDRNGPRCLPFSTTHLAPPLAHSSATYSLQDLPGDSSDIGQVRGCELLSLVELGACRLGLQRCATPDGMSSACAYLPISGQRANRMPLLHRMLPGL